MSQTKTTIHRLLGVSVGLSLLLATSAAGDNSTPVDEEVPLLVEGTWDGVYNLLLSGRHDAKFIVDRDEAGAWNIEMIVDLKPKKDFTYTFDEIVLDDDTLSFAFGKEGRERECTLERLRNSNLEGDCFYRSDPKRKVKATMEMRWPLPHGGTGAGKAADESAPTAAPAE